MIDEVRQHGNKVIDEVKNLWGYHIFKIAIVLVAVSLVIQMNKCIKCNHECHCVMDFHADEYGMCTCEDCECTIRDDDRTWENEVVYEK